MAGKVAAMPDQPDWLPPLVLFTDYDGNWDRYVEALYDFFKQDWVDSKPTFRGTAFRLKRYPIEQGKESTFWHFISEGKIEEDRLPDFRRCERVRWPRPIVEHADDDQETIKVWENTRKGKTRILLWFEAQEYLVILEQRKGYLLPWTAYPVTRGHTKQKLQKEYEDYKKTNAATD